MVLRGYSTDVVLYEPTPIYMNLLNALTTLIVFFICVYCMVLARKRV